MPQTLLRILKEQDPCNDEHQRETIFPQPSSIPGDLSVFKDITWNLTSEIQNGHWLQLWFLSTGKKSISHFDVGNFLKKKFKTDVEILTFDVILYFSQDKMGNVMLYITQLFVIISTLLIYYILFFCFFLKSIFRRKSGQNPSQPSCTLWMNLNNKAPPYQMLKQKKLRHLSY